MEAFVKRSLRRTENMLSPENCSYLPEDWRTRKWLWLYFTVHLLDKYNELKEPKDKGSTEKETHKWATQSHQPLYFLFYVTYIFPFYLLLRSHKENKCWISRQPALAQWLYLSLRKIFVWLQNFKTCFALKIRQRQPPGFHFSEAEFCTVGTHPRQEMTAFHLQTSGLLWRTRGVCMDAF